ncbi:MAG: AAA family ATPase [Deltaproteobacteria bacterium]|nr:AAA family ATPase [Deltaproteobacteria bacterium]
MVSAQNNVVDIRAAIIGNSGSGKTWLANRLAAVKQSPVIHLDEIFWQPGGFNRKRTPVEIEQRIAASKQPASWIVEGVFGELAAMYLDETEVLIWLDIDWQTCKARLEARGSESKRHMNREQSEKGLRDLIEWASHYYDRP